MKVILLSRWFPIGLSVSIRKDMVADFSKLFKCKPETAFTSILKDVDYFRQGLEPVYISKYAAKRIASFSASDDPNCFIHLVYEKR